MLGSRPPQNGQVITVGVTQWKKPAAASIMLPIRLAQSRH